MESIHHQASGRNNETVQPEQWVDLYGDQLYRYALVRVRNTANAQDLVQDTFLSAYQSKDSYSGEASVRNWLFGILKHKIADHFRRIPRENIQSAIESLDEGFREQLQEHGVHKGCWKKETGPVDWNSPDSSLSDEEFWKVLHECIGRLPRAAMQVFLLRELDGLKGGEICNTLKLTKNQYWVVMHRARAALQRCLQKHWFKP